MNDTRRGTKLGGYRFASGCLAVLRRGTGGFLLSVLLISGQAVEVFGGMNSPNQIRYLHGWPWTYLVRVATMPTVTEHPIAWTNAAVWRFYDGAEFHFSLFDLIADILALAVVVASLRAIKKRISVWVAARLRVSLKGFLVVVSIGCCAAAFVQYGVRYYKDAHMAARRAENLQNSVIEWDGPYLVCILLGEGFVPDWAWYPTTWELSCDGNDPNEIVRLLSEMPTLTDIKFTGRLDPEILVAVKSRNALRSICLQDVEIDENTVQILINGWTVDALVFNDCIVKSISAFDQLRNPFGGLSTVSKCDCGAELRWRTPPGALPFCPVCRSFRQQMICDWKNAGFGCRVHVNDGRETQYDANEFNALLDELF